MKIYTEVNWKWNDSGTELVEISSKNEEYNGKLALCSGADFNPFAKGGGNWGWLGAPATTKLGTMRKGQAGGHLDKVMTTTLGSPGSGGGGQMVYGRGASDTLYPTEGEFKRLWSDPWLKKQAKEPLAGMKQDWAVDTTLSEAIGQTVEMPYLAGTGGQLTQLENELIAGEAAYDETLAAAQQKDIDALALERETKQKYERDEAKLGRAQAEKLRGGYQQSGEIKAAGSQSGFEQSGSVDRLQQMSQGMTKEGLQDIAAAKDIAKKERDKGYSKAEEFRTGTEGSEAMRAQAELDWTGAQDAYRTGLDNIQSEAFGSLDTYFQDIRNIQSEDRSLEKLVRSEGKWGSELWADPGTLSDWKAIDTKVSDARGALQSWLSSEGSLGE